MADGLVGIIGGTGLGEVLAEHIRDAEFRDVETPFGKPSGSIMVGKVGERRAAFLNRHGRGHKLCPSEIPFAANIFALKKLGVRTVLGSGAVGSLRDEIAPGDLVIVDQFIDKTYRRQSSFFGGFGAVHCEMSEPVCGRVREILFEAAKRVDVRTHARGCYVCMEGPQFSTRAESLMHRAWGGDLIGMTAMPEAKLAREAQMCYCLVGLASDYDCWRRHEEGKGPGQRHAGASKQTLLQEIVSNLETATKNCLKLIEAVLQSDAELIREDCRCRTSLDLAVWTEQGQIGEDERARLGVLFE